MSAPGWYPDPGGDGQRYFDGARWTEHRAAPVEGLSKAERAAVLDEALVFHHARVLNRTPTTAAIMVGQPVNHVLHLLASVFLCGLWIPVWILIAATGGEKHATISVDPSGRVHWSGPGGAIYQQPAGGPGAPPVRQPAQRPSPFRD